jgi:hypothetical protein
MSIHFIPRHKPAVASCAKCGAQLQGPFCTECGAPATTGPHDTTGDGSIRAAPGVPAAPGASRTRRKPLMIIAGVAVLAVVAIVAVVAVRVYSTSSTHAGPSADTVYRQKVAAAFGPLLGANQQLSQELRSVSGTNPRRPRDAVSAAQRAVATASGALDVLTVPAGSQAIAVSARQVLNREDAFLSAVSAVLADPTNPSRGELVTLQSNLQSALTAAGPTIAGTNPAISGASEVTAWAPRAARAHQRAQRAASGSPAPGSASAPANPYVAGRDCGDGVYAGPSTSCAFAFNVRQAWQDAPGMTNSVTVYSPTTGAEYQMSCAPSGSAISCSGGNNASVTFRPY